MSLGGVNNSGISRLWQGFCCLPGIGVGLAVYNQPHAYYGATDPFEVARKIPHAPDSDAPHPEHTAARKEIVYSEAAIISHFLTVLTLIALAALEIMHPGYIALGILNLVAIEVHRALIDRAEKMLPDHPKNQAIRARVRQGIQDVYDMHIPPSTKRAAREALLGDPVSRSIL